MAPFGDETFSQKIDDILRLSEENNRMLRAMRREKWFGTAAKIVVWILVFGASYYFLMQFLSPLMGSLEQLQHLTGAQTTATSTNDFQKAIDLYKQYKSTF